MDRQLKNEWDAPTVGLVLCRDGNRTVVEYALSATDMPMGVAKYKLARRIPKELADMKQTVYKHEDPDRLYVLKGTKFAVLRKLGKGRKVAITEFNSKNDTKQIAFIKNQPLATRPGENKGG